MNALNPWSARRIGPWVGRCEGGKRRWNFEWGWFIRPFTGKRR